jgi:uncharacterized protein YigE (DUF2233 family)
MTGPRSAARAGRRRLLIVALHLAVPAALIVWLMVAAGERAPLPQWAVGEDSGWKQQEQGLDLRTVKLLWPGRPEIDQKNAEVNLTAVRLDTLRFSLEAAFNPVEDSKTLLDLIRAAKSPAAVNGGYFGLKREPVTLLVSGGKELAKASGKLPWSGVYTLERTGRASVRAYAAMKGLPEGCDFAVQNSPMLVAGGQLVWPPPKPVGKEKEKDEDKHPLRHRRTAAGVDYEGRTVLAVSDSLVSLEEWALLLRAAEKIGGLGLRDAVNLDGGPSSGLAAQSGDQATHVPTGVPVPYAVLARRRPEALPALQTPPQPGQTPVEKPSGEFITPK